MTPAGDRWPIRLALIAGLGIAAGAFRRVAERAFDQVMAAEATERKHGAILGLIIDMPGAVLAAGPSLRLLRRPSPRR